MAREMEMRNGKPVSANPSFSSDEEEREDQEEEEEITNGSTE